MTTTAQYRKQAREAAESLDFARAADLYQRAIDVYPGNTAPGTLGAADVATLKRARDSYVSQAAAADLTPTI